MSPTTSLRLWRSTPSSFHRWDAPNHLRRPCGADSIRCGGGLAFVLRSHPDRDADAPLPLSWMLWEDPPGEPTVAFRNSSPRGSPTSGRTVRGTVLRQVLGGGDLYAWGGRPRLWRSRRASRQSRTPLHLPIIGVRSQQDHGVAVAAGESGTVGVGADGDGLGNRRRDIESSGDRVWHGARSITSDFVVFSCLALLHRSPPRPRSCLAATMQPCATWSRCLCNSLNPQWWRVQCYIRGASCWRPRARWSRALAVLMSCASSSANQMVFLWHPTGRGWSVVESPSSSVSGTAADTPQTFR